MIAKKVIDQYQKIKSLEYIHGMRINGDPVNFGLPNLISCLDYLLGKKQVRKEIIQGDFFGQSVHNYLYSFPDDSYIIIGNNDGIEHYKITNKKKDIPELNDGLYYENN